MRLRLGSLTVALTALIATPALAAPDRQGTVGASSPSYAWAGGPGTSYGVNLPELGGASAGNFIGCFDGIADCEETLIKVDDAGTLTVTAKADDQSKDVLDLYLYPSSADGTYDDSGSDIAEGTGASETPDEKITTQAKPGYYMAVVKFFDAAGDTYKGGATLSGFAAPAAAPAPSAAPEPAPTPSTSPQPAPAPQQPSGGTTTSKPKASSKKAACTKKAKKIKNASKRKKALKRCKKLK
jgi:hypothetical protein